jgi:glucan 1,3-beta-glucosidase
VSLAILGDIACSSMSLRRERLANPWKGVNFGGWLLLEPGPSHPLFSQHTLPGGHEARCEWDFLVALQQAKGKAYAAEVVRKHRETHTTKTDFEKARACGINAIRLPIGYWILLGPREGDPYVGPAIDFVDKAVDWAEACGLQIVLDLHGCPGGESGEAPCGRRQRPDGTWHWRDWDFAQSLKALDVLASRYHSRKCVTGVAVCNEPSNEVPARTLCRYYDKAINKVRNAGMPASRVAVILPCFQRLEGEDKFIECFHGMFGNKHRNICFDVHCYHCFENGYNGMSLAAHMRAIGENADMLRKHPIVVGEWSLALGCAAWQTCGDMQQNTVYRTFAAAQMEAFKESTHGSFFWNWAERDGVEWNYQAASAEGFFFQGRHRYGQHGMEEVKILSSSCCTPLHPKQKFPGAKPSVYVSSTGDISMLRIHRSKPGGLTRVIGKSSHSSQLQMSTKRIGAAFETEILFACKRIVVITCRLMTHKFQQRAGSKVLPVTLCCISAMRQFSRIVQLSTSQAGPHPE